jgi:uncharacterized protein YoxC
VPQDLSTTNLLLGIIAGVQTIFLLGVIVALLYVRRTVTQVQATVRDLEREHVRPLRAQAERILGDVSRISARVEAQAARLDGSLSESIDAAERQVQRVRSAVHAVTRETTAVASGVRAAVAAVAGRAARQPHDNPTIAGHRPVVVSEEDRPHASSF